MARATERFLDDYSDLLFSLVSDMEGEGLLDAAIQPILVPLIDFVQQWVVEDSHLLNFPLSAKVNSPLPDPPAASA